MWEDKSGAFRCRVQAGSDYGQIRICRKKRDVRVLEVSRAEFVIECNDLQLNLYRLDRKARVWFAEEVWDVVVTGLEENNDGRHRVILSRVKDRTPPLKLERERWVRLPKNSLGSDPVLPTALILAFIAACFILPGIGDTFGTAPKIKQSIAQMIRNWAG